MGWNGMGGVGEGRKEERRVKDVGEEEDGRDGR